MQDYEASISFLGTWGRFQMKVFFLLCVTCLPAGYNILSVIFLLATPPHQCYIPAHRNLSQDWMQASIPLQVAGQLERSSCSRYELDLVQNLSELGIRPNLGQIYNYSALGASAGVMLSSLKQEECKDGWIYSTEHYESTVVTEFNLVCGNRWKQLLTSLIYFLGGLCGCFLSGQLSDRFGRKPVLFGAIATLSIFSLALKFAQSWAVFAVLFFMVGMGQLTSYIVLFVLGSEILAGSSRVLYASMCLPFMLIPESPRWLVSKGRLQEAERLLRSAALENGVEAPPVIFLSANVQQSDSKKAETLNFLDLLKAKSIRSVTLILWFLWLSTHVTYSGLSFNMSTLYGNPFLNYFLLSAVELPAYTVSWLSACRLSRRLSFISFSLLGALALFLIQVTLHSHPALTLFLVLLGKFGVLVGTGILYMFTGELSPTVIRNTVMSSCAMLSRVGSSISPYLLQLAVFYEFLPWMLVGSLSLVSVVLCFFLPETFREPLPDTIDQMQAIQRFRWPCAFKPPQKDDMKSAKDQTSLPEIICSTRF
ncbi:solute carrier family 22 member 4 isoform X2 [Maylandia zebra]|uniref:solute carrier family 22 member 4 isoform X2 n=1 Tax=Maylandia zebra TaxID=106582 RepID=UPI00403C9BF0